MRPLLKVSNSDISLFKRCRRKWNLGSFNRRNLVPKRPNTKLWLGTGCHYALQHWTKYGGSLDVIEAFNQWCDAEFDRLSSLLGTSANASFWNEIYKVADLGREVLAHYASWAIKNDNFRMVATEYEFSVPIIDTSIPLAKNGEIEDWVIREWGLNFQEHPDFVSTYVNKHLFDSETLTIPALFVGRLDGIIQDSEGYFWVIDHKFMAKAIPQEILLLDEQTSKYVWAAKEAIKYGWWNALPSDAVLRGAYYNVVVKKIPKIPELTTTGRTSKKKLDTTQSVFTRTLLERGEDPRDFKEILESLDGAEKKYFQRYPIFRGRDELYLIGQRLTYEYKEMARCGEQGFNLDNPLLYPTPTKDCSWECAFNSICYAANYGGDAEFTIQQSMQAHDRTYYKSDQPGALDLELHFEDYVDNE